MGARNDATRPRRLVPFALVGFAVLFNLVVLRSELRPVSHVNDNALHLQMVKWASHEVAAGRSPVDGWYPSLGLGAPHFKQYHSTAHQLTGIAARAVGAETALRLTLYLLLALWPLSVFWGARLLGWSHWASAGASLVSPLIVSQPGYGFEHASYVWRGFGLWSQIWAMWTVPIALGLGWRAISRGRGYAVAALALAATVAFHMIVGYLALLCLGVWALLKRGEITRRIGRAVLLGAGTAGVAAWVLVPLLAEAPWMNASSFARGTFWLDSFGARKVLGWLVSGELLDAGRFPIVTLLAAAGFGVCIAKARTVEPARALLGLFALGLLLFFGRPTLGPVLKLLPGAGDLQMHRFVFGVQLAGIVMAGAGVAWLGTVLGRVVRRAWDRPLPAVVVGVAAVALLMPGWRQMAAYHRAGAAWIQTQRAADAGPDGADIAALIEIAKRRGDARVYAGMRSGWGRDYKVGSAPVYSLLMEREADAVGYTLRVASLSTDFEAFFDETSLDHYRLFNVGYLLMPADRTPPVRARLLDSRGRHRLWSVDSGGYVSLVDAGRTVVADRTNLVDRLGWFLRSEELRRGTHPVVAFAGRPAHDAVQPGGGGPTGRVTGADRTSPGTFAASVVADRPGVVMLKASFHPGWRAYVDGGPVRTLMLAPSLVGVPVPAGNHVVVFRYEPFPAYPLLYAIGALTLIALARIPRHSRDRRSGVLPEARPESQRDDGRIGLSIVVPAYNEQSRIADTIRRIDAAMPSGSELIVVDDGSTDGTADVAAAFVERVRVVPMPENRGKGAAVRRGVLESRGRAVVFMDADLSTDLEALPRLLAQLAEADVVIGSRGVPGSVVQGDSAIRSRLGRTFAQIQRLVMRMDVADSQCGFKAFRGEVARQLFPLATIDGFAFDAEILFLARRIGYRVVEVPVRWRAAPGSKVRAVRDSAAMLRDLLAIRLRWPHRERPSPQAVLEPQGARAS